MHRGIEERGSGISLLSQLSQFFSPDAWRRRGLTPEQQEQKLLYDAGGEFDSAFEVFLKYSTQKEALASALAPFFLQQSIAGSMRVADFGTGEGTLIIKLHKHLIRIGLTNQVNFTLVEPNFAYIIGLRRLAQFLREEEDLIQITPVRSTLELYNQDNGFNSFDAVLCSHTIYHFEKHRFPELFSKMLEMVKPGGQLYLVARRPDGIFHFIKRYYQRVNNRPFNDSNIEDALPILENLCQKNNCLELTTQNIDAQVVFPWQSHAVDAQTLVGFYLRKKWEEISNGIKTEIHSEFGGQDYTMPTRDGIVVVTKTK